MQKATSRGRNILAFGKSATRALLNAYCSENYAVVTVFTGHQHSDREMKKKLKMNGIYNLWAHSNLRGNILKIIDEFPVWTLNASPHHNGNRVGSSVYYGHDTYVLFNFKDWALKVINTIVSKKSKRDTSDLFG